MKIILESKSYISSDESCNDSDDCETDIPKEKSFKVHTLGWQIDFVNESFDTLDLQMQHVCEAEMVNPRHT